MSLGEPNPGPHAADVPAAAALAQARLEAYGRVARAASTARDGPLRAPVQQLSDEQLAALFAPRQLERLVWGPLGR